MGVRAWVPRALLVAALASLVACASLPPQDRRVASRAYTDTAETALGRLAVPPASAAPAYSGFRALGDPLLAYGARVLLARKAERSLDLQYYIWHNDTTGILMLRELWSAAERGVRVRLLLDDNGIAGLDPLLAALDAHPGIEVRLFNPFVVRSPKTIGYLTDFRRLNRRMHNKSFTADSSATIVGGRNVGDEYFGAGQGTLFADLDVLAVGQAARDVSDAFDEYWNSRSAYLAADILRKVKPLSPDALAARFAASSHSPQGERYGEAVAARVADEVLAGVNALTWAPATLLFDDPAKTEGQADRTGLLLTRLLDSAGGVDASLDIVSPYFVPGKRGAEHLSEAARKGVDLRIVTNSLVATDASVVHAGYAKRRAGLLRAGVKLYEMRPDTARPAKADRGRGFAFSGSKSSLHAKTFAIDREQLFVGSFNLDQRSISLNTEMGLLIRSPALAEGLSQALDEHLGRRAWEVRLQDDGHGLVWIEQGNPGKTVYTRDPGAGAGKRVFVWLVSWLPLEWML